MRVIPPLFPGAPLQQQKLIQQQPRHEEVMADALAAAHAESPGVLRMTQQVEQGVGTFLDAVQEDAMTTSERDWKTLTSTLPAPTRWVKTWMRGAPAVSARTFS